MYNIIYYSFIIPHHNSPNLLNRCLNSIPQRDDIEIIVIDDNSDEDKKPKLSRPDVKLISIDEEHTKGAGRARNYGLVEANGKWIIFADCDDFYEENFILELDKYKDSDNDVIIWDFYGSYDLNKKTCIDGDANLYIKALAHDPHNLNLQKALKFRINAPWNKMFNNAFVKRNNFQFEEVPKGNDAFFTMSAMEKANKVSFIFKRLYYWVKTDTGLTHSKNKEGLLAKTSLSKASQIKIRNKAWGTIVLLHSGWKTIYSKNGFSFTLRLTFKKLFNGTPWLKVYFQRWRFVSEANRIIKRHQA